MKLVKPSWKIIDQKPGLEGIYEQIELAGRTCYKSERKEDTTAKDFVDKMINRGHLGVLEHGTVYLKIRKGTYAYSHYVIVCEPDDDFMSSSHELSYMPYTKVNIQDDYIYVTTNMRVLQENNWLDDLHYLCEPTTYHEKRVTVKFVSMIQFYKDLTRHRKMSYCIESTRYCNYSKDKFDSELTFIIPSWMDIKDGTRINLVRDGSNVWDGMVCGVDRCKDIFSPTEMQFLYGLKVAENMYMNIVFNWKPQQAAKVLPQDTKADIIVTGFVSDWDYIFSMRTSIIAKTGQPDTEVSLLMDPLYNEFKNRNLI